MGAQYDDPIPLPPPVITYCLSVYLLSKSLASTYTHTLTGPRLQGVHGTGPRGGAVHGRGAVAVGGRGGLEGRNLVCDSSLSACECLSGPQREKERIAEAMEEENRRAKPSHARFVLSCPLSFLLLCYLNRTTASSFVCDLVPLAPVAAVLVLLVLRSAIPTTKRDKSTLSHTQMTHLSPLLPAFSIPVY